MNPVSAGTSGAPDPATASVSAMTPVRSVPVLVTVTDVTFPPDRSNADADHTRGPGDVSRSGGVSSATTTVEPRTNSGLRQVSPPATLHSPFTTSPVGVVTV